MTFYSLILFLHVTAVLALFAALAFEALSLFRLRNAADAAEVRLWIDPVPKLPLAAMGSLLIILFSGVYLMVRISAFDAAWPKVTVAAMLFITPIAAISGRRMRTIRHASALAPAIDSNLRSRLRDPFLKISLGVRIAMMLGIVLLMNAKPPLWESIGVVGISAALGFLSPFLLSRRTASWTVTSPDTSPDL
jgi:hypothetical protein